MKITQEPINKAVSATTETFEMTDVSTLVERTQVKPMLLTALLGGETNEIFLTTKRVDYEEIAETLQLPTAKAYDDYGTDLQKDNALRRTYNVSSRGYRWNVAPADYAGKRIAGTEDLMDEAYLVSKMVSKGDSAWDLDTELGFAQLLTTDTNLGGDHPTGTSYNFYTDIYGEARPAKTDMELSVEKNHFQAFVEQVDILEEELEKSMNSSTMKVAICGKTFFAQRLEIEKQEGLARDLRSTLDLASMSVPESNFGAGNGKFNYQWFDSHDGIRYIRYTASIKGTKLIGDNDAYLIPIGAENFFKIAYAPAQTRTYVNTTAQKRYAWSKEDERKGVTVMEESNKLFMNVTPKLIVPLTTTTS